MEIIEKIKRIPNRIKRIVLQFAVFKIVSELFYKKQVEKHVNHLPEIYSEDLTLIESLRQEGAFITSLEELEIPTTSQLLVGAEKLVPELLTFKSDQSRNSNHVESLPLFKLMKYPEIFMWGLEERLLNIIENYIGLPVLYHGAHFRREVANGKLIGVRQWHTDVEDHRMVRIIVYLNNVTLNGGSFEYISKYLTSSLRKTLRYTSGFVSDEIMKTFVPTSDWKPCLGRSGTVIFSDTRNVFHRARPPVEADRFSITFSYTSRRPIAIFNKVILTRDEFLEISSRLSIRQRQCILGYNNCF
ncbi:hypothetical protein NIES4071_51480 [Calothrix sp. NIES-4071]|nr:hypothetical protein NIES4071_51480 [Calothrix sp. NIES-4071]BAZ59456.1 hypothetical protein NIES4105_51430 [Calothrix sp. NIES-4105]